MNNLPHTTVLLEETVSLLNICPGDTVVDCTVGGGGHTVLLAEKVGPSGRVIGLDRDESALALAHSRLRDLALDTRVDLVHAPFSDVAQILHRMSLQGKVQGVIADIGVSSMHLDEAGRGFSFQVDGPLDMRMDKSQGVTAEYLINTSGEDELSRIFRDYGEEPKARLIARKIIESRNTQPFHSTLELAAFIKAKLHYPSPSRKHPATRIFQALRIAVNDELGQLQKLLQDGFDLLKTEGRLAIISFHSLEDRLVKESFVDFSGKAKMASIPRGLPLNAKDLAKLTNARAKIIKPFPLIPTEEEIARNPRSRSAKLRVIEKI